MSRGEQYPSAPTVTFKDSERAYEERREYFARRNKAIQEAAIKAPKSGTFGKGTVER